MLDLGARAGAWLLARGVGRGDRVALLAENDGAWCAAYLGILRVGAVAVPLDTTYTVAQVTRVLRDSGAVALFTSERHEAHAAGAAREAGGIPTAIVHRDFERLTPAPQACRLELSDPAVMLYTSGTTADPKGVVLTHGNVLAERTGAFQVVRVDERDAILSVLPLFHALAQMANLLLPFSVGARVIFLETLNTGELTRALRERGVTAFVCVPQFFYLLHQRIEQEIRKRPLPLRAVVRGLAALNLRVRRSLGVNPGRVLFRSIHRSLGPDLRLLITGGARFDPAVNEALYALGFSIRQAYGLTECSGAATISEDGDPHFASVGKPMPGVEIRIRPSEAASDERAGHGEVLSRGGIVMQGYFGRPDQTALALKDGWLHTGDLGCLDADGRLFITGRSKEVIVLGSGKNVYPEEIEAHYERSPFIEELCVVGLTRPGEPSAERLHALIRPDAEALRARGAVNMRELLRFELESLSVQLSGHKRILGFDITLDPLPRTTTRKLKRFEIEKQLAAVQAAAAAEAGAGAGRIRTSAAAPRTLWDEDPLSARLAELIRQAAGREAPLAPDEHLELDLGLDSMERVELLVHVTGTLRITIPDEEAQTLHTVGDLVSACRSRVNADWDAAEASQPWERVLQERPAQDGFLDELHKPKRTRALVLFLLVKLAVGLLRLTAGVRARGAEHLPPRGPYLISPNHQSYLDVFILVGLLPFGAFRQMFFVGAAEYFQSPFMRWLARSLNVAPIDPDANLLGAMQAGAYGLRLGKVLVLFPEGERSIDGTVKAFRKGAAILSQHTGAPIVPVAIDGAWDLWARGRAINWRALLPGRRARLRVQFGSPIPPRRDGDYAAQTRELRERVMDIWEKIKMKDEK